MIMLKASEREVLGLAGLLVAAGGLEGVAGAGAVHQDPLLAVGRRGLVEGRVDSSSEGDVALAEDAAHFLGNGFALGSVHVEDGDLDAWAASARTVASPRPEAPPVTRPRRRMN
jgi:hypothetical protein